MAINIDILFELLKQNVSFLIYVALAKGFFDTKNDIKDKFFFKLTKYYCFSNIIFSPLTFLAPFTFARRYFHTLLR